MNNTKNSHWLSVATIILLVANIVTLVLLWSHKRNGGGDQKHPPPPSGPVFEFVSRELQFDSLQKEAYSRLRDEHRAAQQPLQDSIGKVKDAFFALLQQPNVADSTIEAAAKRAGEAEQQLEILTFRHFQKVRILCKPEQQKKFDSIIQDVLRRMSPPKGRQGPPPPDGRGEGPEGPDKFPPPPGTENEPPPPPH